jgi:hypothetical protein
MYRCPWTAKHFNQCSGRATGQSLRNPGGLHENPLPQRARAIRQAPFETPSPPIHRTEVHGALILLQTNLRHADRKLSAEHPRGQWRDLARLSLVIFPLI